MRGNFITQPLAEVIQFSWENITNWIAQNQQFFYNFIYATIIAVVGIFGGKFLANIMKKFLDIIDVDKWSKKVKFDKFLKYLGFNIPLSILLKNVFLFLIYFITFTCIALVLELKGILELISAILEFIPKMFAALTIILFGLFASRLIGKIAELFFNRSLIAHIAKEAGTDISLANFINHLVGYFVFGLALLSALNVLGISELILNTLIIVTGIGICLIIVISTRDISPNIVAGFYIQLCGILKKDSMITIGNISGKVQKLTFMYTEISHNGEITRIPNSEILKTKITIK